MRVYERARAHVGEGGPAFRLVSPIPLYFLNSENKLDFSLHIPANTSRRASPQGASSQHALSLPQAAPEPEARALSTLL